MPDPDQNERLKSLDARISAAKKARAPEKPHQETHYSQANMAWRMVIELVAGLGIGFGIGFGLDTLLGTTPWMMVLFIFFGLAAGVQTMLRTAKEIGKRQQAPGAGKDGDDDGD